MAQEFQTKGAESQKNAVRDRVQKAIARLREANQGIPAEERKEITLEDVANEAPVSTKTLEREYHASLLRDVHVFLTQINVGVAIDATKRTRPVRKTSVFRQNDELLQRVEALRYQLRTERAEKQHQFDAMAARIAALTDEISTLRRRRPADRTTLPKKTSRRSKAA